VSKLRVDICSCKCQVTLEGAAFGSASQEVDASRPIQHLLEVKIHALRFRNKNEELHSTAAAHGCLGIFKFQTASQVIQDSAAPIFSADLFAPRRRV